MQLKIQTDYAIRIVLYLAIVKQVRTSKEISDALVIPQSMVIKIGRKLNNSEIIDIRTGVQGGFSLRKKTKTISLMDIVKTMELTVKINRCLEEDGFCSRCATQTCPVRKAYCKIQKEFEENMSKITVYDLMT